MQDYSTPTPTRNPIKGSDIPSKVNVQFPEGIKPQGGATKPATPAGFDSSLINGKV